ncbi:MAG: PKD domain-containing protein [Bacteroidales bacterium]|nr:PKD domain-containing protein [Bacteroidales bacterium]
MNKFKLFTLVFSLLSVFLLPSCVIEVNDDDVDAYFTTEYSEYKVGETIYFDNHSHNADECEWDFDDGYRSDVYHPEHYYTRPGTYRVELCVRNGFHHSDYSKILYIYE